MSIHNLPLELLLIIFRLVATHPPKDGDAVTVCTWLSHVCRKWRELAISCEQLWTVVPRRSIHWTKLCLSRCPYAPLDLDFKALFANDPDYRHAVRLTFPRFMRAKRLRLELDSNAETLLHEILAVLPAWPLVAVKDVAIIFKEPMSLRRSAAPSQQLSLPASLFPLTLMSAYIENCSLSDGFRFSTSLRKVEFVDVKPWSTISIMVQFFHDLPQLQYFSHRLTKDANQMSIDWEASLPDVHVVKLDHLQGLHLEGPLTQNFLIFSCLAIPSSAALVIRSSDFVSNRTWVGQPLGGRFKQLITRNSSALRSHFSEVIMRGLHYDSIRLETRTRIRGIRDEAAQTHQWRLPSACHELPDLLLEAPLFIGLDGAVDYDRASLHAILCLPVFTPASTIEFGRASMQNDCTILHEFKTARVVQFETLEDVQAFAVEASLQRRSKRLCPMLECIRLVGINIDSTDLDVLSRIINQILRRTYRGRDIRLKLCRCFITAGLLENLEKAVSPWLVIHDGYEPPTIAAEPDARPALRTKLALRRM